MQQHLIFSIALIVADSSFWGKADAVEEISYRSITFNMSQSLSPFSSLLPPSLKLVFHELFYALNSTS